MDNAPIMLQLRQKPTKSPEQEANISPEEMAQAILHDAQVRAAQIADQLVKQAEQQAASIIDAANRQGEEIKSKAHIQGHQEGINKAKAEADKIRRQAREVLSQAEEVRRQTFTYMEQEILNLSVEIAEKLLNTQLTLDPEIIIDAVQYSVQMVKDRQRVTLYVNPADLGVYIGAKQQLEQTLSDRAVLTFIADPDIKPGGCLVDTDQGLVDATMDARWREVLKAVYPT